MYLYHREVNLFDRRPSLARRATPNETRRITLIVLTIAVGAVLVLALGLYLLRSLRKRHSDPKYIPTPFLKRLWSKWRASPSETSYHAAGSEDTSTQAPSENRDNATPSSRRRGTNAANSAARQGSGRRGDTNSAPDRTTSVRSVMTLPPYRVDPLSSEQVIAREGERDGVDVVVELPTEEDLEALRDEEMETMYQIRQARRLEILEREERRRQRREARARNDVVALEVIRSRARASSNNSVVNVLRQDHERIRDQRQRTVSSVSYADLGVARHDGTRIRANSTESERVGLLSDAASIAVSNHSGARSPDERERSSSILTIDSDFPSPSLQQQRSRASSRADSAVGEADVGDSEMPPYSPPGYEDVSLDEGLSGTVTPVAEPPPGYPGDSRPRASADSGRAATVSEDEQSERRTSSRGVDGIPQLPSLRLNRIPQIVIEPLSPGRTT
ncbi:hypothetical protein jhhlp_004720 [Lomentospora prolificans]|uniref:Uncharacterized protein n=1 Tax=Lomentospora prolificans TaxID=41688 RepID=A0A2N3N8E7_9PEZI|nr:hypothetical protein jhhlp_004720 [Lomentospora prolificans]